MLRAVETRKAVPAALIGSLLVLLLGPGAQAQTPSAKGRTVIAKCNNAVVTVKLTIKMRMAMGGGEMDKEENTSESTALVIDPSGLAVLPLSQADPSAMIRQIMGGRDPQFKIESEVSDVKIRLADGKELPAKIVLRDKDLDVAFVRPNAKPAQPLAAVDLAGAAKPEVLDEVVVLDRLGEVANRVCGASLDRVQAIITKPRTLYVLQNCDSLGCTAFSLEGKVIGLQVLRAMVTPGGGSMRGDRGMMPVLLPAGDILEAAKHVKP